ncbi:hypothetical protein GH714_016179 [Hevea brasiliensis]|uniref:HTH La-type RNA-binding domain-containing protein n=1 Tax=Hevea brasiliensis TaxID=3981 RepID=A0A6A6LZ20_HEVBR|nr:hypothetical protein GH714_016179 [Hevea brasiliensis]
MATTANALSTSIASTPTNHSPRHPTPAAAVENHNRPHSRRGSGGGSRVVSSPWTQIVRGESETITVAATHSPSAREPMVVTDQPVLVASSSSSLMTTAEEEILDNGNVSNSNAAKRPVWNKPSNGATEVGPVMGAVSWPALSESARASGKPSQDLSKGLSDGSSELGASSSSHKQVSNNASPNSTPNHTMSARQRSMKRNGANTSSNGGSPQPPGSQPQTGEVHLNNPSPRDHSQRNSQSRGANDHPQQQRNSFRRNGGPHSRGDGSHHHNYGGRRDQDRANQDWNTHRNFNSRDNHMQPHRVVQRFIRHPPPPPPPPTTAPFIGSPMRAFSSPIGFHEFYYFAGPPPDTLRGMPFVAAPIQPPAMYFTTPDPQLHSKIVNQIDYYFSNDNLIKDTFLRQNMDDQGWVSIKLIAGFNKLETSHRETKCISNENLVRIHELKMLVNHSWRQSKEAKRLDEMDNATFYSVSKCFGPPSLRRSSHDMLAAHVQSISLEENAASHSSGRSPADVHNEAFIGRSSSGELNSQSLVSTTEGTGQVSVRGGSDSST